MGQELLLGIRVLSPSQGQKSPSWLLSKGLLEMTMPFQQLIHDLHCICFQECKRFPIGCVINLQSVVVITKLPLMNLFTQLCALMGLEFFDKGIGVMKVIAREINEWPAPVPGQVIHLFLRGVLYQVKKCV